MSTNNIFLAVLGGSAAVVTETLYAYLFPQPHSENDKTEPMIPDKIVIITTTFSDKKARQYLLGENSQINQLYAEYGYPPIQESQIRLELMTDAQGKPLDDIRTQADNEAVADAITKIMRELCENKNNTLYVSMAGGRKTMSFYMAYVLSLLGRPQDELTHVLIDENKIKQLPRFEGYEPYKVTENFFFPLKSEQQDIQISLGDVPFVLFSTDIADIDSAYTHDFIQGESFSQTIKSIQEKISPPDISLKRDQQGKYQIFISDTPLKINPRQLLLYCWLLKNRKDNGGKTNSSNEKEVQISVENALYGKDEQENKAKACESTEKLLKIAKCLDLLTNKLENELIDSNQNKKPLTADFFQSNVSRLKDNEIIKKLPLYNIEHKNKKNHHTTYKLSNKIKAQHIKIPECLTNLDL